MLSRAWKFLTLRSYLLKHKYYCNFRIFVRILFSHIALRHIPPVKNSQLGHDLPTSVNDIVITLFREGFIFTKLRIREVLRKLNTRENFWIYSNKIWRRRSCSLNSIFMAIWWVDHMEYSTGWITQWLKLEEAMLMGPSRVKKTWEFVLKT